VPDILEVNSLRCVFGGVVAVDDVSFNVRAGEVFGIIGPNGAGKTTVLNCLSGSVSTSGGFATMGDARLTGMAPHMIMQSGVGRTLQLAEYFRDFSVLEFVMLGRRWHLPSSVWMYGLGLRRGRRREREEIAAVQRILERFGLADVATRPLRSLGYGVQRLADLARAVAGEPTLLLLDEPTSGSSTEDRDFLRHLVPSLRTSGISIVLVDHDVSFVSAVADRALAMAAGRCLTIGEPRDVLGHPEVISSYLGRRHGTTTLATSD
jgi:ABC-type branched-subunit amino acid transport system ATPase component